MKKIIIIALSLFATYSCSEGESKETSNKVEVYKNEVSEKQSVFVNIVVGSDKAEHTTVWKENQSALEVLQYVANVVTKPVAGKYVFVTKIDSVAGIKGVNGWYYTINGNKATKLAINQTVQPGDTIQWNFKADICSKTVDKADCEK